MENDRDQVKLLLKGRIEDLCRKLLPATDRQCGRHGRLWVAYNPVTSDHNHSTPELKVGLDRDAGAWKDWRSGDKGDVLGLIQYVEQCDFRQAMVWARDFLGLQTMSPAERRALDERVKVQKRESDDRAEQDRLRTIAHAGRKFMDAQPFGAGGAAERHALAYLTSRQCGLVAVPQMDRETFRFHPASEYWRLAEYGKDADGRRFKHANGPLYPAIHSAMRGPTGVLAAVHVTFLDPVRPVKISLGKENASKLMLGEARGAVIRIAQGPEGVPPERAVHAHPLVLCEGIETGLSLAAAIPEARVWAAGSLSNMANAPVGLDCISAIIVARDNNDGNVQAQKQLDTVLATLAAAGKPLEVIASIVGDDFNDLARGEE